jgi:hypothetical protein
MKKIFRSIVALLCCGAIFASCEQEVAPVELSADLTSIEVEAQNPAEVSVNLSANTSWLLTTPKRWRSGPGRGSTFIWPFIGAKRPFWRPTATIPASLCTISSLR